MKNSNTKKPLEFKSFCRHVSSTVLVKDNKEDKQNEKWFSLLRSAIPDRHTDKTLDDKHALFSPFSPHSWLCGEHFALSSSSPSTWLELSFLPWLDFCLKTNQPESKIAMLFYLFVQDDRRDDDNDADDNDNEMHIHIHASICQIFHVIVYYSEKSGRMVR